MSRNLKLLLQLTSLVPLVILFQNCNEFESLSSNASLSSSASQYEEVSPEDGSSSPPGDEDIIDEDPVEDPTEDPMPDPEVVSGSHLNNDNGLTNDSVEIKQALGIEVRFYNELVEFDKHLDKYFTNSGYTDASAQKATYSSASGWAAYHSLQSSRVLTNMIYLATDDQHLLDYAKVAMNYLNHIVPALVKGEGTGNCPASGSLYRCRKNHYRFLDASHAIGAIGPLLLAMNRRDVIKSRYGDEILSFAEQIVPEMEIIKQTYSPEKMEASQRFIHMVSKSAPGFYAIGLLLDKQDYVDAFWKHVSLIVKNIKGDGPVPKGWVSSDVTHAELTIYTLVFSYQEKLRMNTDIDLKVDYLKSVGEYFHKQLANDIKSSTTIQKIVVYFKAGNLGHYGSFVKLSDDILKRYEDKKWYQARPTNSLHAASSYFANIGGLAMGFAGNW